MFVTGQWGRSEVNENRRVRGSRWPHRSLWLKDRQCLEKVPKSQIYAVER